MRIFISYAFSGEDERSVVERLRRVVDAIGDTGHEVYCFHFDPERREDMTEAQCIRLALEKMNGYDTVFVLGTSERRSEGMLIEVGAAMAKNLSIVYAQHESSLGKTYLPTLAAATFSWTSERDLIEKIKEFFVQYKSA